MALVLSTWWAFGKFPYDPSSPAQRQGSRTNPPKESVSKSFGLVAAMFSLGMKTGRVTTVPVDSGETIGPGLLRSILRDVELSVNHVIHHS